MIILSKYVSQFLFATKADTEMWCVSVQDHISVFFPLLFFLQISWRAVTIQSMYDVHLVTFPCWPPPTHSTQIGVIEIWAHAFFRYRQPVQPHIIEADKYVIQTKNIHQLWALLKCTWQENKFAFLFFIGVKCECMSLGKRDAITGRKEKVLPHTFYLPVRHVRINKPVSANENPC